MRDMMEDKKFVVWTNVGGIMRDRKADKKVLVWAKVRGILGNKMRTTWSLCGPMCGAY